jgi:hypothetical protein
MATSKMASLDEITDDFLDSCGLWISDDEYEQQTLLNGKPNPLYVHQNCRAAAEEILAEWKRKDGSRMVLLCSQMQSGKTSVMRHLAYLLNVKQECKALGLERDSVYILCNIAVNSLLKQTQDRMEGVMMDPKTNVAHPRCAAFAVDGALQAKLSSDRVLIIDESHYGTAASGQIARVLIKYNSPLFNDQRKMVKHNLYVLLVSATPFAEMGFNTEHKKMVTLKTAGTNYYGLKQMLDAKRIADASQVKMLHHEATTETFRLGLEMMVKTFKAGFVFVRVNTASKKCKVWAKNFKAYLNSLVCDKAGVRLCTYFEFEQDTTATVMRLYKSCVGAKAYLICAGKARKEALAGLDAVLCSPPDRVVFIFVKRLLLAGTCIIRMRYVVCLTLYYVVCRQFH